MSIIKIEMRYSEPRYATEEQLENLTALELMNEFAEVTYDTGLDAAEAQQEADGEIASEEELSEVFDAMLDDVDQHDGQDLEDYPAMAEWFNNWSDSLCKDGQILEVQYSDYTYVGKNQTLRHG